MVMKKKLLLVTFLFMGLFSVVESSLTVNSTQHAKIKVIIGLVGTDNAELREVVTTMKKNFESAGQFDVAVRLFDSVNSAKVIKNLFKQEYLLALFVQACEDEHAFALRLYDTAHAQMLKGKQYSKRGSAPRWWAHNITDMIWPELTGQEGSFSTNIAYCKETIDEKKRRVKYIYIADYDGTHERRLISTPTINVAPRWNRDVSNPLLFYSECTNENIRLMVANMKGERRIASNFDGLNMLPSFSKDGTKVVYCASRGHGNCQLYYYEKGCFKKLTNNNANNVSPTLSDDGTNVFFCSDFQNGIPHIYCYDLIRDTMQKITESGYCVSPCYSEKVQKIAYVKRVQGVMQIFLYNVTTKRHTQLTYNEGNKEECSWSPCGNYLLFSVTIGGRSKIARLNLLTDEYRFLASDSEYYSYPCWSPRYDTVTVVG